MILIYIYRACVNKNINKLKRLLVTTILKKQKQLWGIIDKAEKLNAVKCKRYFEIVATRIVLRYPVNPPSYQPDSKPVISLFMLRVDLTI